MVKVKFRNLIILFSLLSLIFFSGIPIGRASVVYEIEFNIVDALVNDYTTSDQNLPSICALTNETIAIVWESNEQEGDGYGVYMRAVNVTTGNTIISEYQVNNYTTGNQWYSGICALSNKDVVVVWESDGQDGDGYGIYLSISTLVSSISNGKLEIIPDYDLYIIISVIGLVIGMGIMVKLRKRQKKG